MKLAAARSGRPPRRAGALTPAPLLLLALVAPAPALAGNTGGAADPHAAAEAAKFGDSLLERHRGATEERIVTIMGKPAESGSADGGRRLVWRSPAAAKEGPVCALTAGFKDDHLASLTVSGAPRYDSKTCHKLARPLLNASAQPQTGSATITTLTNAVILDLVKEGYPVEAIVARIRNEPCKFDLSNEATMSLRREGVKDPIIQAMIDRGCS
jgi:hypothetical protein